MGASVTRCMGIVTIPESTSVITVMGLSTNIYGAPKTVGYVTVVAHDFKSSKLVGWLLVDEC